MMVAAGILTRQDGRVLISQRPAGKHMADAWEFPGGKITSSETPLQGLVRELDEELGIRVCYVRHMMQFTHAYPERTVHLHFWKVLGWDGEPSGREGQALRWLPVADLGQADLLPADQVIIDMLGNRSALNTMSWKTLVKAVRA
ncbi:MAG: 8-oxo-dGTP diphosphatase MutT [Gammaproteobacteria bacterium]